MTSHQETFVTSPPWSCKTAEQRALKLLSRSFSACSPALKNSTSSLWASVLFSPRDKSSEMGLAPPLSPVSRNSADTAISQGEMDRRPSELAHCSTSRPPWTRTVSLRQHSRRDAGRSPPDWLKWSSTNTNVYRRILLHRLLTYFGQTKQALLRSVYFRGGRRAESCLHWAEHWRWVPSRLRPGWSDTALSPSH